MTKIISNWKKKKPKQQKTPNNPTSIVAQDSISK